MKKRVYSILFLGLMIFLAGCGSRNDKIPRIEEKKEAVIMYQSTQEMIESNLKGVYWNDIRVVEDTLYYSARRITNWGTAAELAKNSGNGLFKYIEGENPQQIINTHGNGFFYLNIAVDAEENIYTFRLEGSKELLQKYNTDGELLYQTDIRDLTEVLKDDQGTISNSQLTASGQGLCFISGNGGYLVLDTQGHVLGSGKVDWMKEGMYPLTGDYGFVNGANDTYLFHRDGRKIYLEAVDYEAGTLKVPVEISLPQISKVAANTNFAGSMYQASDQGMYIVDYESLLHYDEVSGEVTKVFDWNEPGISVDHDNIQAITEDENGNLRFYIYSYNLEQASVVTVSKEEAERVLVSIGVLEANMAIFEEKGIRDYNLSQEDVFVAIKKYEDIYDLQQAVLEGEELDILELTGVDIKEYIQKDILVSLDTYLEESDSLNEDDILPAVLETMKYDEKVYFLAPRFQIWNLLLADSVTSKEGLTVQRFLTLATAENGYLCDWDREKVFQTLLAGEMDKYVNWEKKACSFDDGEFAQYLEAVMVADLPEETSVNLYQDMQNGIYPAAFRTVMNLQQVKEMREAMEQIASFNALPGDDQAYGLTHLGGMLGVLQDSENKEEAWDFLEYYMKTDTDKHVDHYKAFSVLTDQFEAQVEARAKGNSIYVFISRYTGQQVREDFKYMDEDRELARSLSENVKMTRINGYAGVIGDMIKEEATQFFEGVRNAEETAAVIQQRVFEYMKQ